MPIYQCKAAILSGTSYAEVRKKAVNVFGVVKRRTKRKPYVRSSYFGKRKVFFDNFWIHLSQKREPERRRRLRFFAAALELIEATRFKPISKQNPNKKTETLHRFVGKTTNGELFYVQIKETGRKKKTLHLMSIFPETRGK